MNTMKRFTKYIVWIILFWILSDILIYFGINTTYKDLEIKGTIPDGIEIVQMQATKVNGRIKLKANNAELIGKTIKIDLYSANNIKLGTQYIQIENKEIEKYFKISDVKSYEITIVDEVGESTEGFMDTALSAITIFVTLIKFI